MRNGTRLALTLALLAAASPSTAQDATTDAQAQNSKFMEYLDGTHLRERLEGHREGVRGASHEQIRVIVAQFKQQVPNLPAELLAEFERDGDAMVDESLDSWTIDQALAKYVEPFERSYPGGQLDAAIALLNSEDGKKLERTLRDAMFNMTSFVYEREGLSLQRQILRFSRQVSQRAEEFRATRK